jgi:hypothetical protein
VLGTISLPGVDAQPCGPRSGLAVPVGVGLIPRVIRPPGGLRPPRQQVEQPAPACVPLSLAAVVQDAGVGTARLLQGIRQDGQCGCHAPTSRRQVSVFCTGPSKRRSPAW